MLSAATARLVDGAAALGEAELVRIKGSDKPVAAQRLLGMGDRHRATERAETNLVGRRWEMSAVEGLLDRAGDGHGAAVGVAGSPGITHSAISYSWGIGVPGSLRWIGALIAPASARSRRRRGGRAPAAPT